MKKNVTIYMDLYEVFSLPIYCTAGEKLVSSLSRLVLVIWLFVVLILTSSYTASLTSILTVQKLNPTVKDVESLKASGEAVGYQKGSFVAEYLQQELGIAKENLRHIQHQRKLERLSQRAQRMEALLPFSTRFLISAFF
jgi:ionotropic glutamate receptor